MRRRFLPLVPLLLAVSACGAAPAEGPRPGGPTTPASVPIDLGPSATVAGNSMRTGLVVGGKEMVLYFWRTSGPADKVIASARIRPGVGEQKGG